MMITESSKKKWNISLISARGKEPVFLRSKYLKMQEALDLLLPLL